jgi:hypothetical protein
MAAPASPLAATLSSAAPSLPKRDGGGVSRMGAEQQLEPRRGGVARRRHRHSAEGDIYKWTRRAKVEEKCTFVQNV